MGFKCGIVGLPNVGKSTIFNAITSAGAEAANYPFCTIEPNVGIVTVPDPRLDVLSGIVNPQNVLPTTMEFVDIAGLVKGASRGEGLGNQFLGHIRSVDTIAHVVRCFEDENITHVHGTIDPVNDIETITTELIFADLDSVEKRIKKVEKLAKGGDKESKAMLEACGFTPQNMTVDLLRYEYQPNPKSFIKWALFQLIRTIGKGDAILASTAFSHNQVEDRTYEISNL